MEFTQGVFQKFRATNKIHLGSIQQDIMEGGVVEYDGTSLKIGDKVHNVPSVAGAIRLGWLVPIADNVSKYIAQPAGVQVRSADAHTQDRGKATTIAPAVDDQQEVGTLAASKAKTAAALAEQNPAAAKVQKTAAPIVVAEPVKPKFTVIVEEPPEEIEFFVEGKRSAKNLPVDQEIEGFGDDEDLGNFEGDGDARPVARLGSATQKMILTDPAAADRAIRSLDSKDGPGLKVRKIAAISRTNEDAEGGIPMTQTHATGATGDVAEMMSGDDLSDILPDAASSGTPRAGIVRQGADGDARLDWDKSLQWRQRVKKAVEVYGSDANAIKQILEVEDAAVVKHIRLALDKK